MTKIISNTDNTVVKPALLIVDDEPLIRKSLTRILTKEGYNVNSVDEGKKVFKGDLLQKTDVILLDLFLGKESGFDVLEKVTQMIFQFLQMSFLRIGNYQLRAHLV